MKIDIFNISEFIKENHVKEVTSPVFFNVDKSPTEDGLFSYEIFGYSMEDRKNIFGYIDLHGYYFHPLVYYLLSTRLGSFSGIVDGEKYAILGPDNRIMIVEPDTPNAETGIDFFYNNFEKINWIDNISESEMQSIDKKTRLKFFKYLKKDQFFIKEWLVIPPHYREESSENKSMGDIINKRYKDLLNKTNSIKNGGLYSFFGNKTRSEIQKIVYDLFNTTLTPVSGKTLTKENELVGKGKNSLLRRNLLGKNVEFTASSVITSPNIAVKASYKDMPVRFGYSKFPLASLVSLFNPFFVNGIYNLLNDIFSNIVLNLETTHSIKKIDKQQFDLKYVEKLLTKFIKSETERFNPISFEYINNDNKLIKEYLTLIEIPLDGSESDKIIRKMTMIDIVYIIARIVLRDKHVYVTRYPVDNYKSIFPSKIEIATTSKERKVKIMLSDMSLPAKFDDSIILDEHYPSIKDPALNCTNADCNFINVYIPGNIYIKAMGGDYDGDMMYMKGVFSIEANQEAERLIYQKSNIIDIDGSTRRAMASIGKEVCVSLYELTKEGD